MPARQSTKALTNEQADRLAEKVGAAIDKLVHSEVPMPLPHGKGSPSLEPPIIPSKPI